MKRRLKQEILNKRKHKPFDQQTEEAKEFEESLLKLAQLARGKIKLTDFSSQDKVSLLDFFVNNEAVLLKIYENLFPHRGFNVGEEDNKSQTYRTTSYKAIGIAGETDHYGQTFVTDDELSLSTNKGNKTLMLLDSINNSVRWKDCNLFREMIEWRK